MTPNPYEIPETEAQVAPGLNGFVHQPASVYPGSVVAEPPLVFPVLMVGLLIGVADADEALYVMVPAAACPAGSMLGIKTPDSKVTSAVIRATGSRRPELVFCPFRLILRLLATFYPHLT